MAPQGREEREVMGVTGEIVTAAVVRERLSTRGKFDYVCILGGTVRHAISREILHDCIWHGEVCDFWSMLVEPFDVAMLLADAGEQSAREATS